MILRADARAIPVRDGVVQCVVTSPPYWGLRDYGVSGQLGLEGSPEEYVQNMVLVFREVRRVLRDDGVLWLNLGDSYAMNFTGGKGRRSTAEEKDRAIDSVDKPRRVIPFGLKPKDLVGIPWRVAFALQADGWYLRSDIIWAKPNPMPESVTDRPTKAHEYIFLMSKEARYYYDADAIAEKSEWYELDKRAVNGPSSGIKVQDGKYAMQSCGAFRKDGMRNRRTVWDIPTQPYLGSHFATFPEEIPRLCILAGSRPGDVVLDPFGGSGTTSKVALELGRRPIHMDITYHDLARRRMTTTPAMAGLL